MIKETICDFKNGSCCNLVAQKGNSLDELKYKTYCVDITKTEVELVEAPKKIWGYKCSPFVTAMARLYPGTLIGIVGIVTAYI